MPWALKITATSQGMKKMTGEGRKNYHGASKQANKFWRCERGADMFDRDPLAVNKRRIFAQRGTPGELPSALTHVTLFFNVSRVTD